MERSYGDLCITPELLEELKRKALVLEDEIAIQGGRMFERTGKFNDPVVCEICVAYENLNLDIEKFETMLAEAKAAEAKAAEEKAAKAKKTGKNLPDMNNR